MRYIISGRNIEMTEALKNAIEDKLGKLERFFTPDTEAQITLSVQKERHIIEVTIPVKGQIIRGEEVDTNMYAAIDNVVDIIERQLIKYKKKIIDKHHSGGSFKKEFLQQVEEPIDDDIKILKTKRFAVKPMDEEEACFQMELLGHNFFVFRNSESDEVNVVYKRKNNSYGLIEPEF
ncbi:SSU ribosomal protein S30P /sigma 54 modulation protein [Natranaerovirga pectinivora]|uniref:Ribosome hibernation promoting factor n=1 Tax=Natranaerovirga pectinivora TaxID=682400 RepID=A0A4R3MLQ8_9FIRM|nr:ribosome-associated translation inhibitor RaiA [Natranaerovirga pectinivora]TCT13801.1 SSU ribosomal protein S30P /sigma 54 modulation protein [Natranaerovirga pectinivora]